jgi:hypothetical protein
VPDDVMTVTLDSQGFNRTRIADAFKQHYFSNPSLALSSPATFGQFRYAARPRVFQFALRYEV